MFEDELVETSDLEELEELEKPKTLKSEYTANGDIRRREDSYSPRKRIKLHHQWEGQGEFAHSHFSSPSASVSGAPITPLKSQSSTTIGNSSPLFLERSPTRVGNSRSPTNSPLDKLASFPLSPAFKGNSQDPLLLCSPVKTSREVADLSRLPFTNRAQIQSPRNDYLNPSPQESDTSMKSLLYHVSTPSARADSVNPLEFPESPPPRNASIQKSPLSYQEPLSPEPLKKSIDGGFLPVAAFLPSSPLSPSHPQQLGSERKTPREISRPPLDELPSSSPLFSPVAPSRSISPIRLNPTPPPPLEVGPISEENAIAIVKAKQGYSFRARKAVQIAPYSVDKLTYKLALKANPDAIVKVRSPGKHHHRHPDDRYEGEGLEETQEDGYVYDAEEDEDADWEARERRRRRLSDKDHSHDVRSRSPGLAASAVQYPEILQALSSSDEDENQETSLLLKEAKKVARMKEKERKAKEREQASREKELRKANKLSTKRFPLKRPGSERDHRRPRTSVSLSSPRLGNGGERSAGGENATDEAMDTNGSEPHSNVDRDREHALLEDFGGDDALGVGGDVDMYDQDNFEPQVAHQDPFSDAEEVLPLNGPDSGYEDLPARTPESLSDGEEKRTNFSPQGSDAESDQPIIPFDSKVFKTLTRTMPVFMAKKYVSGNVTAPKQKARHSSISASVDDTDEPSGQLLPGQSRTRRMANPADFRTIKGDSESENELSDRSEPSETQGATRRRQRSISLSSTSSHGSRGGAPHSRPRLQKQSNSVVIDISDDDSSSSSEDEGVGDVDIQACLADDSILPARRGDHPGSKSHGRSEYYLIDYMLSQGFNTDRLTKKRVKSSSATVGGHENKSRRKFDVVTGGVRRERQTLLDFSKTTVSKRKKKSSDGRRRDRVDGTRFDHGGSKAAKEHYSSGVADSFDDENSNMHQISGDYHDNKMSYKEREKLRKSRARKQGVYVFDGGATRIVTGRRRETAHITLDFEDEEFHRVVQPDWDASFPLDKPAARPLAANCRAKNLGNDNQALPKVKFAQRNLRADMGIRFLHSGIAFWPRTFIRVGYLHELVSVITFSMEPPLPPKTMLCGFEFGPATNIREFCSFLPNICSAMLEFETSLPDEDSKMREKEWQIVKRNICQLASWLLSFATPDDRRPLCKVAEEQVKALVSALDEMPLDGVSANISILSTCWFAVDFASRFANYHPDRPAGLATEPVEKSVAVLIRYLMTLSLTHTINPVLQETIHDDESVAAYAAQLWVSLIHLLSGWTSARNKVNIPTFWKVVSDVLEGKIAKVTRPIEASEQIWEVVFSLCALSQFSIHGMTKDTVHLTPCWELITVAIDKVRLVFTNADAKLPERILEQRDQYVKVVLTRCLHLRDCWRWNFADAIPLLTQLGKIFSSRMFGNLRCERQPNFPVFVVENNLELLSNYHHKDTAFLVFWKLIVHAYRDEKLVNNGKLSPRMKKLLGIAVPVSACPTVAPPNRQDLSMLYNRMTAVIIALHLDHTQCDAQISRARKYVNFSKAEPGTRNVIMRGIMLWAFIMIKDTLEITGLMEWVGEIATCLSEELRNVASALREDPSPSAERDQLCMTVKILIHCVYKIIDAQKSAGLPPDTTWLLNLTPIFTSWMATGHHRNFYKELYNLSHTFLLARASAVIPWRSRRVVQEVDPESQDMYGDDLDGIDWDGLEVPDALASSAPTNSTTASDNLKNVIYNSRIEWLFHRQICALLKFSEPETTEFNLLTCKGWIFCWIGIKAIGNQDQQGRMYIEEMFKKLGEDQQIKDDNWRRVILVALMLSVLQHHPETYLTYKDRALEYLLYSLVSVFSEMEGEYVALVLSIDGLNHTLLKGLDACLPAPSSPSADFEITPAQFGGVRLPLLKGILKNLGSSLETQSSGDVMSEPENQKYVGFCTSMFSAMRSIRASLAPGSSKHQTYTTLCRQTSDALREFTALRREPRLVFWTSWGASLT